MYDTFGRKFRTVVMDGTDTEIVNFIMSDLIDDMNFEKYGKSTCQPLDDKHPSMIVIETYTTEDMYHTMQGVIDKCYPGLCIFNPPI
jgi:predicted double-glycine peptidase